MAKKGYYATGNKIQFDLYIECQEALEDAVMRSRDHCGARAGTPDGTGPQWAADLVLASA